MGGMFLYARVLSVQSKMASKEQALLERVVRFYDTHGHRGKKFTVDHFRDENVPVSTVNRFLASLSVEWKAGSGRPAKIMTKKKKEALKKLFDNKDGTSLRDAGRKYRTLKMRNIICRKKTRSPEYMDEQIATVKSQCRWMTLDIVRAGRRKLLSALEDPHSRK